MNRVSDSSLRVDHNISEIADKEIPFWRLMITMSCFNIADVYHVPGIKQFSQFNSFNFLVAPEINSNISVRVKYYFESTILLKRNLHEKGSTNNLY